MMKRQWRPLRLYQQEYRRSERVASAVRHRSASLIDPSVVPPGPTLPSSHPFQNVQSAGYWSATTSAEDASDAWFVYFGRGFVDHDSKTLTGHVWCVRGVMNAEAY